MASSPFAHVLQCVAMSAVCLFVNAAALVVYVASYSYSGTCSNNQFCCSRKYYDFETIQPCHGTPIASQEMSPSGEGSCELMEKHAMP